MGAVSDGVIHRQAEIDSRSDALVEFLTGPQPTSPSEAHSIIFAAMQAIIEGNEFPRAWRENVIAALFMLGCVVRS